MTRNATIIQVFVASPSDVQIERDLLEALVIELNRTWSVTLGVMFELIKWETQVHPSFGVDPQEVINHQIGNLYDVFIGILWGRFGTPTPRALSGTAEEFENAYSRFEQSSKQPEIMIYFKDAPISPSKIDPSQLKMVHSFRDSLASRGGLYSVFEDEAGFQSSLRAHLATLAQKFSKLELDKPPQQGLSIISIPSLAVDEDDLGYLDYLEIYDSRIKELTLTLTVISEATVRIGEQFNYRTNEMQQLITAGTDAQTSRRYMKRAADDMHTYAEIMSLQLPSMASSRAGAFQALSRALTLYDDFSYTDQTDLIGLQAGLEMLNAVIGESLSGLAGFRLSVSTMPRMTSDLNKAKRAVLNQLDSMMVEIDKTAHTIGNILESIDLMIPK